MFTRRMFLGGIAGSAAMAACAELPTAKLMPTPAGARKPNIVFFLVDDLGWGDFGCYGNTFHETPNIDQLAREGLKFTDAYAGAPVCSPSRACILTGKSPARLHLTQWIPGSVYPNKKLLEPKTPDFLDLDVPTIAEILKKDGYKTAAIGKWHLGGEGHLPENFGFDLNIAGDNDGHPGPPNNYFGPFSYHNLTGYTKNDYLTDVLTTKMDSFLGQASKDGPFFLYMAEYAVHLPLQAPAPATAPYLKKNGGKAEPDAVYAAMVHSVDVALGHLRKSLEKNGLADNTIIILTSDNGGVGFQGKSLHRIADNGPYRAGKGFLYEGGIREPLIVHWPGVVIPGSVCNAPVTGEDFVPTILSMIHSGPPPLPCDGIDLTALFRNPKLTTGRDALYWHYPHYSDQGGTPTGAIREGDWKLIEFFEDDHLELYNLSVDPGEGYNLASTFSEKATYLQRKLAKWRQSVDAQMPTINPEYNQKTAGLKKGPSGCSWEPGLDCKED
jgi:arylsulfatase A